MNSQCSSSVIPSRWNCTRTVCYVHQSMVNDAFINPVTINSQCSFSAVLTAPETSAKPISRWWTNLHWVPYEFRDSERPVQFQCSSSAVLTAPETSAKSISWWWTNLHWVPYEFRDSEQSVQFQCSFSAVLWDPPDFWTRIYHNNQLNKSTFQIETEWIKSDPNQLT